MHIIIKRNWRKIFLYRDMLKEKERKPRDMRGKDWMKKYE